MKGTYTHIPETNYVPREYSVAAILFLLFMVLISLISVLKLLYFYLLLLLLLSSSSLSPFMKGIYTHIPETNYVPREYSVAAILLFLFMVLISLVSVLNLLYFYLLLLLLLSYLVTGLVCLVLLLNQR